MSKINNIYTRTGLNIAGLAPIIGPGFSAISGFLADKAQSKINEFLDFRVQMLEDELREQRQTFIEIIQRLDWQDEKIIKTTSSYDFQSLCKRLLGIGEQLRVKIKGNT